MIGKPEKWQYILLLLLVPPVGAFLICADEHIRLSCKIAAACYCVAVFIAVLSIRMPAGNVTIHAVPMD